jgi:ferredoxin
LTIIHLRQGKNCQTFYTKNMPTITFLPADICITVPLGTPLREAVHLAGLEVQDRCGGMGACASCSVLIVEGQENTTSPTTAETVVGYLANNERLSCQCKVLGDVVVKLEEA